MDKYDPLKPPVWLTPSLIPINLNPSPGQPFNDTVLRIAQSDWNEFYQIRAWEVIFPYPEFTPQKKVRRITTLGIEYFSTEESIRLQQTEWQNQARDFFVKVREVIIEKRSQVIEHVASSLRQHELRLGHLLNLDANKLAKQWLASKEIYTVANMYYLNTYEKPIFAFVAEKVREYLDRMGLNQTVSSEISTRQQNPDTEQLSLRQIALLYAYQSSRIWPDNNNEIAAKYGHTSGHRLQQEYNKVKDTANRLAYGNESKRVINALVKDIRIVIAHLSNSQSEQAHYEVNTIMAKLP